MPERIIFLDKMGDLFIFGKWIILIAGIIIVCIAVSIRIHTAAKNCIYEKSVNKFLNGKRKKITKVSGKYKKMGGYEFENYVAKRLKAMGYQNVKITAKSSDFGADILAKDWKGVKICFQCKKYYGPVGIKAVQEAASAKVFYGCKRAAVITTSTFTSAAVKLAKSSDVELYEGFK